MILRDDQRCWIGEGLVGSQNGRVDVPVRRHDRERARFLAYLAGVLAGCWIRIEIAILAVLRHTTGFQRGSYSRDHSRDASASWRMWPFVESVVSLRPTCWEIVPR